MKKILQIITILTLVITLISCSNTSEDTIKVIATTTPHGEILEFARDLLEEKGFELEIIITSDYYFPNPAVSAGDADANFFQHVPFLDKYNAENPNSQLSIGAYVHIEPIGIYSNNYNNVLEIEDGATVLISNSTSDHGRVLNLFQSAGLITIKEGVDITSPTLIIQDAIETNPKNLVFNANVSPDFLFAAYTNEEADLYVINSNYVLEGGKNPVTESIFIEETANNPYVNILAIKESNLNSPKILALIEILQSKEVQDFINATYNGSVIPA